MVKWYMWVSALQWVPDTGEVVSWGKDEVTPRRYSSVSSSMGAHVGRTGGCWRVMGKVEFGLWSVQGAEMPYFNLGMGCCSVSNALCSVFQLYSCRMVMLAATVFCLWGIFCVWTVERMEGILTDMESMHMGVHQGAWMLNSLPFKCTLVQTNLLGNG